MLTTFGLKFVVNMNLITKVFSSALYLPLNYIPTLFRQTPRLVIASVLPQFAHIYQIFAQVGQLFSLMFDV